MLKFDIHTHMLPEKWPDLSSAAVIEEMNLDEQTTAKLFANSMLEWLALSREDFE